MSILDAAIMVGVESTYGTPATLTRAYEGKADAFKREQARLESVGFRAGMETLRSDRVVTVPMGGSASLELDVMTNGMGLLFGGLLGGAISPALQDTTAYLQTYTSTAAAPTDSYTFQILRPELESGTQAYTYHGGKIVSWGVSQSNDGLLVMTLDYDFEDSDVSTGAGTPSYIASQTPFDWSQCTATIDVDGSPTVLNAIDVKFDADLAMKTDRRYLRASALKKEPVRTGIPEYSGEVTIDLEDTVRYAEWVAGTVVDLELKWQGALIESTYYYEFAIRMQACQWTDGNPEASLSDTSVVTLPFRALDDGTNAAVVVTYQNTDSAI